MASNWVQRAGRVREVETTTVVTADMEIPFGTKVETRHLKTLTMPASTRRPGSFNELKEVDGQVTVQPIVAGEILMRERFADDEDGSTLAASLSEKMRAVTVG